MRGFIVLFALLSPLAKADIPSITNLNSTQTDALFRTLAADLAFRPVEPATMFARKFGLAFGVTGIATSTRDLSAAFPGQTMPKYIPGGNFFFAVQLPYAFAIELGALPTHSIGAATFYTAGGDLKWTISRYLAPRFPIAFALRGMYTRARLDYGETVTNGTVNVDYQTTIVGGNLSGSFHLLQIFQPFFGAGLIKQTGLINASGSANFFATNFSTSGSAKGIDTSPWFFAGLQMRLLILTLSGEWDMMFGNQTAAVKVGFKF